MDISINIPFFLGVIVSFILVIVSKYFAKKTKNEKIEQTGIVSAAVILILIIVYTYL